MEDEHEVTDVTYEIVKDANVSRFFAYEIEIDEATGFISDDAGNCLGAVVHFNQYPDHGTLTSIFDDLLNCAVQHTQDVDAEEASEMIEACDDEDDFEDEFDISSTFSLLFTVAGHKGLYRTLLDTNDYWTGHSSGHKGDRFEI
jgi:hypothetical protein